MTTGSPKKQGGPNPTLATPLVMSDESLAPSNNLLALAEQLDQHESDDPSQLALAQRMAEFARGHDDALLRSCPDAHFTGSALVVEEGTSRFILLFHTKLQKWLQPGGHVDGNANLAASALREALEETGIEGLRVVQPAFDLDIHEVRPPNEPPHLHLDVRFVVLAPKGSVPVGNHESRELRWVTADELQEFDVDESVRRLVRQGLILLENIDA
jgi:8-oxo-dGTP pyrophosphatase MutT (NUDIX family)